jgi:hypothetical protein
VHFFSVVPHDPSIVTQFIETMELLRVQRPENNIEAELTISMRMERLKEKVVL